MAASRNKAEKPARKPNFQPNHLPAMLGLEIAHQGVVLGVLGVEQLPTLSAANDSITFSGGIGAKAGWELPTDDVFATIGALSFRVGAIANPDKGIALGDDAVALAVSEAGVHRSKAGNTTVCHTAVIALPRNGDVEDVERYVTQVYVTRVIDKAAWTLTVSSFPVSAGFGGQPIRGTVVGDGLKFASAS